MKNKLFHVVKHETKKKYWGSAGKPQHILYVDIGGGEQLVPWLQPLLPCG
jgi:hypothetical protein